MAKFRNWWLGLPYPLWTLSSCKPFSPWCFIYDLAQYLFPIMFGWSDHELCLYHYRDTWLTRMHDRSVERYWRKIYPEDFE